MKTFRLKADAKFTANDIDNAMEKLGRHFLSIAEHGLDGEELFDSGEINVELDQDEGEHA